MICCCDVIVTLFGVFKFLLFSWACDPSFMSISIYVIRANFVYKGFARNVETKSKPFWVLTHI